MSTKKLYNRDYMSSNVQNKSNELMLFLRATYQLFAGSLLAASVGSYIGLNMVNILMGPLKWVLFAIELVLIFFIIPKTKHMPGINLAVLFLFTFITGLTIAPLLGSIFAMSNGASIVGQSFLMTSVAFGSISMFAMTTKRDFSYLGKFLIIALIIMIVASVSNIFIQSSMFQLAIASVGSLLFSAFILYDTQKIIKGAFETPVEAALALYLDFLNLFVSLLQLFSFFNSSDD